MKIRLVKEGAYLAPWDSESEEWLNLKHNGQYFECEIVTPRNLKFHKKFFALLNVAFPRWNPGEVTTKHGVAEKSFEQFREDLTIMAGYYEQTIRLDGTVRTRARSISFAAMDDEAFSKFYSACLNVILLRVLVGVTIDEAEQMIGSFL